MTHIPWRQDSCSSKSRSKSLGFVWLWLMIYFISSLWQCYPLPMGKNHLSTTFPSSSLETYIWAHSTSPNCHALLSCSVFTLLSSSRETRDSNYVSKSLGLLGVSSRELFSSLIQWNPGQPLCFPSCCFPTARHALLQVEMVTFLSWLALSLNFRSIFKTMTNSVSMSSWMWECAKIDE